MRKALIIGINYVGSSYELRGCWNDAQNMERFLRDNNYSDIRIMTDEPLNKGTQNEPTMINIRNALVQFVSNAEDGDRLVFHYSGHGGNVHDHSGDEIDGRDECIYPCDGGEIIDDDLRCLLCDTLPKGVELFALLDCCHSGSGLDLPLRYIPGDIEIRENDKPLDANVVSISGCRDDQTSGDLRMGGVLTINLLKILRRGIDNMMWEDLICTLQHETRGYPQVPQLSLSDRSLRKNQVRF
jgi:metacaspase-1